MGQRERDQDPVRQDDAPALGEVPQQQRDPRVRARVAGRRAVDVELHRPAHRAPQQRVQDLRPRPDALGEGPVEDGRARVHERAREGLRGEQHDVGGARPGREQIARPHELGGRAIADLHVERHDALDHQQPQPSAHLRQQRDQVELAGRDLLHPRGHHRPRDEPHPQIEIAREVLVDVEQVAVAAGRAAVGIAAHSALATRRQRVRTVRHLLPPTPPGGRGPGHHIPAPWHDR
jgi:hypothetical protein